MKQKNLFDFILFLYFFTLHADQLHVKISGFTLRLNNLIAFFLFLLFISHYRFKLLKIDRTLFYSLLILTASIILSFILSDYKKRCFFFLCWYGCIIVMYFLLPYLLICYYDREKVIYLYLLSFLFVGIYALIQLAFSLLSLNDPFASQLIWKTIVRPNAFAYEPSFYALYMTPFIVMVNYHFLGDRNRPFFFFKKLTYPKILFINFLYFISTSTSTFFAFGLFCFFLLFSSQVRRHVWKYSLLFVSLFFLLGLISPFLMKTFFLKFFTRDFMSHASFFERWVGIQNAWKVFQTHPYFGVGLGGYPSYLYDAFIAGDSRYTILFSHMALSDAKNLMKLMEPMNVFTEILASLGIVGACAFVGWLFVFINRAKRAIRFDQTYGISLFLSVVIMLIILQINQGVFRTYVWVHCALAFALMQKMALRHLEIQSDQFSLSTPI